MVAFTVLIRNIVPDYLCESTIFNRVLLMRTRARKPPHRPNGDVETEGNDSGMTLEMGEGVEKNTVASSICKRETNNFLQNVQKACGPVYNLILFYDSQNEFLTSGIYKKKVCVALNCPVSVTDTRNRRQMQEM